MSYHEDWAPQITTLTKGEWAIYCREDHLWVGWISIIRTNCCSPIIWQANQTWMSYWKPKTWCVFLVPNTMFHLNKTPKFAPNPKAGEKLAQLRHVVNQDLPLRLVIRVSRRALKQSHSPFSKNVSSINICFNQWIGVRENLNRKPSIFTLNIGFSSKLSRRPIHRH